jgi:hypothetical protein
MSGVRRLRGAILRLARHRRLSFAVGLTLAVPASWVQLAGRFDAWWVEGLSLVGLAIGVSLMWTAVAGVQPDWIDTEPPDTR